MSGRWKYYPPAAVNGRIVQAALSGWGDYTISHRPNNFNVSYRPPGEHHHVGAYTTLAQAKRAAMADWARRSATRDPAHKRARHILRARRRDPRTATVPEAILFPKSRYSTSQANAWLASHGYRKVKPIHTTAQYHRARLRPPSTVRGMRTITFGKGIKAIIGHPRRK